MPILDRLQRPANAGTTPLINLSRRGFLRDAGGLALGLTLAAPALADHGHAMPGSAGDQTVADAPFEPNAFVRIGSDDTVTVISKHLEMGQGAFTGLATLVAEELDADWSRVRVVGAPADVKRYANLLLGVQGTGGSTAMANAHKQMRQAGATARAMLVAAAADRWQVPASEITVRAGVVDHAASGRKARFGALAEAAGQQPVPKDVALKHPDQFTLIGRQHLPRKDSPAKTDGSAMFTQDIKLPGMLVAVVAHPKRFGARLKQVDDRKTRKIKGVIDVVRFRGDAHRFDGVAVLAHNTWTAWQGRDALQVEWDEQHAYTESSDAQFADYHALAQKPGAVARNDGDADAALGRAAQVIEAEYRFPYLAHAPMEPLNCLVQLSDGGCEIWNGEQLQTPDQGAVAHLLGLKPEQVKITQLYAGGSFGRRANPQADYVLEAVAIAKAARDKGHKGPVKLVWTREDDMHGGYYRPANLHRVRAALDAHGKPLAWAQRIVGQSIMKGTPFEAYAIKHGIDSSSVEGAVDLPYAIPNVRVELHSPTRPVPVQWWRSVGHTHTAYVAETMLDELAHAAQQDPVAYRLALLDTADRRRGVLQLVADKAGWSRPLATASDGGRRGRGVAVHQSFNTYVAQVVEVTVAKDGSYRVDRVVCAVDCGLAINPDVIRAQMEGGIGFGLSAILHDAITLKDGVVQQNNFDSYVPLRLQEMPVVETYIVPSAEAPTGVGEPGTPVVGPALANALFAATGKRLRTLPIADQLKA